MNYFAIVMQLDVSRTDRHGSFYNIDNNVMIGRPITPISAIKVNSPRNTRVHLVWTAGSGYLMHEVCTPNLWHHHYKRGELLSTNSGAR